MTKCSPVTDEGQITIDPEVRKQLGIKPGMIAYQRVVHGRLEVIFLPAPHRRSLYGMFEHMGNTSAVITAEELEEAVMEAVAEEQE